MRVETMKLTRFATQRTRAFSFDNFETEKNCLCYCKKRIDQTFSWSALLDHRSDAMKSSKFGTETTRVRLVVPLEF